MTAQLLVKLDETLKQRLAKLARTEGGKKRTPASLYASWSKVT